ncbi:two component transcriptional regulator, LuxR family [Cnuella takakiae]|uniref:Two component transcriptional regulator, LuxR family n=1 Tax=Cnuella takakiae TaxID=1302690 RepID=A0A1M5A1H3_9BACT|nr:response regulator transcription factor [Cnuella takakiae]OLY92130.1 hypothetical protein BUE76_09645 [Cnuella takakiae]SHF24143.1 two component transcriptional regulator, LuxR family [Cnuella takakiae]
MIKIAIIEDNYFLRTTYREYLLAFKNFKVVAANESIEEFEQDAKQKSWEQPDVLLLDIELPGRSGMEAIEQLKQYMPGTKILIISNYESQEQIINSIRNGANGYLVKSSLLLELSKAVMDVCTYGGYFSAVAASKLVDYFTFKVDEGLSIQLSKRELEVIDQLKKGKSYKEIGAALFISAATVNYHLKNIFKKLNVKNKAELISLVLTNAQRA